MQSTLVNIGRTDTVHSCYIGELIQSTLVNIGSTDTVYSC